MAWELLRTDYKDAVPPGLRKFVPIDNGDGSYSFKDVTQYIVYEEAFFGAYDANKINEAVNAIMAALENGTDLYTVFQEFFEIQKTEFEKAANLDLDAFNVFLENLKATADADVTQMKEDYTAEIVAFEKNQEQLFAQWFEWVKEQLSKDAAGNLQLQIESLIEKEFRHYMGLVNQTTDFLPDGSIVQESNEATVTTVKRVSEEGYKVITQTVTVKSVSASYIKTTTIIPATETENKKIIEQYTAGGLAAYVLDIVSVGELTGSIASADTLGMVKVGNGLNISSDGTLSVDTESVAELVVDDMEDFSETEVEEIYDAAETATETTGDKP